MTTTSDDVGADRAPSSPSPSGPSRAESVEPSPVPSTGAPKRLPDGRNHQLWWIASVVALAAGLWRALSVEQRLGTDSFIYLRSVDALWSGDGYDGIRYPPGMAILLTPARLVGWPTAAGWFSVVFGAGLIAAIWWLGHRLGGARTATVAAVICVLSPMIWGSGRMVMADAPAALLVTLAVVAGSYGAWRVCGLLIACSGWVRLGHGLFLLALPRRTAVLWCVLPLLVLAGFQFGVYGSLSGYPEEQASFSLSYLQEPLLRTSTATVATEPNWSIYPRWLLGGDGFLVPLLPVFAGWELWYRRREPTARMAAIVIVCNVVLYLPYFFQSERFLLPAVAMLVAYASAGIVRFVDRLGPVLWPSSSPSTPVAVGSDITDRAGALSRQAHR